MKTIILAAGYATRLYPLTENTPKPLLPVGGKPILDWLIEDLTPVTEEFIVVSNHKFARCFEEWARKYAVLTVDREKPVLGRGGKDSVLERHGEKHAIERDEKSLVLERDEKSSALERVRKEPALVRIVDDGTTTNETRLGAVRDIQYAINQTGIQEDVLILAGDNVLDFSLIPFVNFGKESGCSCIMYHEEEELAKQQRTAIITIDAAGTITSYEEKPQTPKSNLAVPPFYYYKANDISRIQEALDAGCGYDSPGSFAAWLSKQTQMKAYKMPGNRYDIGDLASYEAIKTHYRGKLQ